MTATLSFNELIEPIQKSMMEIVDAQLSSKYVSDLSESLETNKLIFVERKFCTRFLLSNVYKRVCGIFFILFRS